MVNINWFSANTTRIITLPFDLTGDYALNNLNSYVETYAVNSVVKDEISIAFNDAKFLLKSKAGIPMDIFLRKIWAESLGDRGEIYRVNHDSLPALLSFYKNGSPFLFWHRK